MISGFARQVWLTAASSAFMVVWGGSAHSQSPIEAIEAIDMEEIERFASLAHSGSDPRVAASSPEQFSESGALLRKQPATLILIEGEPAFVYIKENWGDDTQDREVFTFVMRCRGAGIVDISSRVFDSRPNYQPDAEAIFDDLFGQIVEFGHSVPAVMNFTPYERNFSYDMPVAVAFEYDQHGTINANGQIQYVDVQLTGAARSDDPFFQNFRGGNLYGQIMINGQYKPMAFQVDLQNFRTTAGPLLEHCRAGNENPMEREFISAPDTLASDPIVEPDTNIDLSFLAGTRSSYLQRIYQGNPSDPNYPLHLRLTIPLAFHAAYSSVCLSQSDIATEDVYTNVFGERVAVPVLPEDFALLFVTAEIYEPVMRKIYDENANNDFSFFEVSSIFQHEMEEWKADWETVLYRNGCTGEVSDRIRENIKAELPFIDYSQDSSNIMVDFGRRQFDISLSAPIDIEAAKELGASEAAIRDDPVFTNSYPGRLLRAIAMGDFAEADAIKQNLRELVSNPLGGDRDNPWSMAIRLAMELESLVSRDAGLLTAYIIGRTYYLGACGDATIVYTQETIYWTEYVNGFGHYAGSSPATTRSTTAEIPIKFDAIIRANDTIETNIFFNREMARILSNLSCESRARLHLEDNLIAYFNGRPPVHIAPVPSD